VEQFGVSTTGAVWVSIGELLERITEFGIWIGRYPAPTKLHHTKPKKLRSGIVNLAGYMYGSDIREVEDLVNRLIEELKGVRISRTVSCSIAGRF